MIEDKSITGTYEACIAAVKQRLNGYLSRYAQVYIGATTDPRVRWERGHSKRFDKMVLLFRTSRPRTCINMEKELIAFARGCNFIVKPDNVMSGGQSIQEGREEYWVYVAVR